MKGSLCLIPSALLLLCKLGSVTKTGNQVPVILQVYFFSEEGSAVLLSEEPVAIPEKWCFNTPLLAVAAMGFLLAGTGGRDVL